MVRADLPRHEQAPLKRLLVGDRGRAPDEDLPVDRLRRLDGVPEVAVVDRHVAPAEQEQPFLGDRLLDRGADDREADLVARHEQVPDAVMAGLGQDDAQRRAFLGEETMRDLHEDAAAVAHLGVGADRPAVVEVAQDVEALRHDGVGPAVLHVGDEADAAGVLLVRGIIEALPLRQARIAHHEPSVGRLGGSRALTRRCAEIVRGGAFFIALRVRLVDPGLADAWLTHG
jgi:hypothetical protein